MKYKIYTIVLLTVFSTFLAAQTKTNLNLGDAVEIPSKILKQSRTVFVYKPFKYQNSNKSYPVIYVFDASGNFLPTVGIVQSLIISGKMPASIIVGIVNIDRTWDFTPIEEEERIGFSGGGNTFLKFIDSELKPFIDSTYRTKPYNTVIGHSLCGMYSLYLLAKKPDLFNSYLAISPHLEYANQYTVSLSEKLFKNTPPQNKTLFFSVGNEPNYLPSLERYSDLLSDYEDYIDWEYQTFEDENHVSVVHPSIYNGLKYIFRDWQMPAALLDENLSGILNYYDNLSAKYCYKVIPSERNLNIAGYRRLGKDKFNEAIEIFQFAVANYPRSANTYDSLGEAFEKSGKIDKAIVNYRKAVDFGKKSDDVNTNLYSKNLQRAMSLKKDKN